MVFSKKSRELQLAYLAYREKRQKKLDDLMKSLFNNSANAKEIKGKYKKYEEESQKKLDKILEEFHESSQKDANANNLNGYNNPNKPQGGGTRRRRRSTRRRRGTRRH
jgi:hypothetical protein